MLVVLVLVFLICLCWGGEAFHHGKSRNSTRCPSRHMSRICPQGDTVCGHWKNDYWHPLGCHYQDITGEDARKCLGNRTLAFIGDSQIRDISIGVAFLLMGETIASSPRIKFDHYSNLSANSTLIPHFDIWKNNVPPHNGNGYIFPKPDDAAKHGWQWQVQTWSLFRNEFISHQVNDVLNNRMSSQFSQLRNIDLAFWNHGLHDYGWFDKEPYGKKYYDTMVHQWIRIREASKVPSVWVSMNSECREKLKFKLSNMDTQFEMVEECNFYANNRLYLEKLPYWDAAAPLRSPQRCEVSNDGVHVNMYVDIMRAKMLFNHLCDENMNWVGSIDRFLI